jgi:IS5 family transposase
LALFTGERKSKACRPPFDCILMFKVLFLQRYYGLGDHQIQYQIIDRTSFRKFLGIRDVRDVPDEKTV